MTVVRTSASDRSGCQIAAVTASIGRVRSSCGSIAHIALARFSSVGAVGTLGSIAIANLHALALRTATEQYGPMRRQDIDDESRTRPSIGPGISSRRVRGRP